MGVIVKYTDWKYLYESANGQLGSSELVPIPTPSGSSQKHMLNPIAAKDYAKMVAAAAEDGIVWGVDNAYRTFARQKELVAQVGLYSKGGLAAEPGTSNHGWGSAIDLKVKAGNKEHSWLTNNAAKFGFSTIPQEPWHWEHKASAAVVKSGQSQSSSQTELRPSPSFSGAESSQPDSSKIYSDKGDPYTYKVIDGQWWAIGPKLPNWTSLENNEKATNILDSRHPGARENSKSTGADSLPQNKAIAATPATDELIKAAPNNAQTGQTDQAILNQIKTGQLVLRSGMSGRPVELIQTKLKEKGYLTTPINGEYDAATYNSVSAIQKEKGINIDGAFGETTYAALYAEKIDETPAVGGKFKSVRQFKKELLPKAEDVVSKLSLKVSPIAILAQWALESANGSSPASAYNYAGIKALGTLKDKKGKPVLAEERYTPEHIEKMKAGKTSEELVRVLGKNDTIRKRGRDVTVDQWYGSGAWQKAKDDGKQWCQVKTYFAEFNDYDDFVSGYVKVIGGKRYKSVIESADNIQDFAYGLAKGGYATASATKYANSVTSKARELENLS